MRKFIKHSDTRNSTFDKPDDLETDVEYCFWESELYLKLKNCRFFKNNSFKFLDNGFISYTFFTWVHKWIKLISKEYVEPYKLHPLPISDQILYWQPIFSKHVSDALIKLDLNESSKSNNNKTNNNTYKSILLRATFLTFWKRMVLILIGILIFCTCNISVVLIIIQIFNFITAEMENFEIVILLTISLAFVQLFIGIFLDHINFYMYRLIHIIQYSFSITIFQHGLCYRRKYFNNIGGSNVLNVCNQVIHSCSPDSECSKNPLFCPALRYQNKDIDSMIFSFEFMDSYYLSLFVESTVYILQFLFNFLIGFSFLPFFVIAKIWPLYIFYISISILMITVEIFNTIILKYIYTLKDYRINKTREIISGLHLIYKMFMDDIAHNTITETRNNELVLILVRFILSFVNRILVSLCISFSLIYLLDNHIHNVIKLDDITGFKSAEVMCCLFLIIKASDSMLFVPDSVKFLTYSLISYFRTENFIKECSPNFYISDNKYTGEHNMSTDTNLVTTEINQNVVVLYKNASFSWINSRKDNIYINNSSDPNLIEIDFELKRGEIVIITGSQGSGKSNFIKSILGEMTLVGGSMAVVPLHTSIPIFYASQDIWLQQGTIRSNITFGYKYDEELYNKVLKAVELEFDISTWENGDLRTISDYAHSLSGGQRVRMETARAIYAYLVFDQVNRKYNNNQCSFLMCLDSTFHGLDPFVSKTVFNNLFNVKSGLLVNDNLSVILTASTRFFDIVSLTEGSFANITLYQVNNKTLEKVKELFPNTETVTTKHLSIVSNIIQPDDMIQLCESQEHTRSLRGEYIKKRYEDSLIINPETKMKGSKFKESFKPYIIYFKSTGSLFTIFIVFTCTYIMLENFAYITAGAMGDDIMDIVVNIKSNAEGMSSYSTISKLCTDAITKIKYLTLLTIVFCFLSNVILTFTCLRGCKRIHEYCIDSLLNNNSTNVRIKKFSSEVLTFLSSDIFMIDENFGPVLSSLLIMFMGVLVQAFAIVYNFPICIPIVCITLFSIVFFVFKHFIHASKNLQIASLESLSRNNFVCEKAVSSSSTYRSFKKESQLLDNVIEYTDYCIRPWLYSKSLLSWASFISKFIFLFMMLLTFIIPVLLKKYKGVISFNGYYGLNLIQNIRIVFSFTNLVVTIAKLEMLMCSIKRFECFVPPGQKCEFKKSRNTNYEDIVINLESYKGLSANEVKETLLSRRRKEFRENNQKFHVIRKLGFKPQIDITVSDFILPQHSGVELKDVYVYTSTEHKSDNMILRNINASANKSEIIGIIGRTGAGKTTLLSVLENTIENRTGQVLLDGKDLKDIPKNVVRQIIGVLPQLPFVFKGWTIRRFLDPRKLFSDDEINESLRNCGLLDFVNNLQGGKRLDSVIVPDNLSNSVFSGNVTSLNIENLKDYYENCDMLLSNTQLRTLSFSRLVLYRNLYRMILVDEPPSENCDTQYIDNTNDLNNDNISYNNNTNKSYSNNNTNSIQFNELGIPIYELLKKYFSHCTTFVTAHDPNALKMCTLVWAMHEGQLIKICKTSDIVQSGSISNIIEQMVKRI